MIRYVAGYGYSNGLIGCSLGLLVRAGIAWIADFGIEHILLRVVFGNIQIGAAYVAVYDLIVLQIVHAAHQTVHHIQQTVHANVRIHLQKLIQRSVFRVLHDHGIWHRQR